MLVAGDSDAHIEKGFEKKTEVEVDIFTMVTYFVSSSHAHTCIFSSPEHVVLMVSYCGQ